jgi:dihydrofolate synthase / folylpolyglutamate synthase
MGYVEARAHLDALGIDVMKSMRPSTRRIEAICAALNDPQHAVPTIHIAGTNGKTSTARILTSILSAAGLSVGTYTSPHLQSVRERIALNGEPISEDAFGDVFDHLLPYLLTVEEDLGEKLTYFEILTAMYLLWAAEAVDASVVEVGLGGKWDATNVVSSSVAVVTNVGLDHTELLGEDRVTIAREKAGIIKPGTEVVTGERRPDVLSVITEGADRSKARSVAAIDKDFRLKDNRIALGGRLIDIESGRASYEELFLPLHGRHQGHNAAVAVEAALRFVPGKTLDREVVALGLGGTFVPGRLEVIRSDDGPPVVLDVAHNPEGTSAFVGSLMETFAFERVTVVAGILRDKDHAGMLSELARLPCSLIVTQPKNARSVPVEELRAEAGELGLACDIVEDVGDALQKARAMTSAEELVCVTGSHYTVGEARDHLLGGLD